MFLVGRFFSQNSKILIVLDETIYPSTCVLKQCILSILVKCLLPVQQGGVKIMLRQEVVSHSVDFPQL